MSGCLVHSGPLTRKTPSRHLPNEFFSFGRNHLSGIVSGRDRWYKSRGTVIMERLIQMCAFLMWLVFIEQNFSKLHYTRLKFNPSGNLVFDFVIQSPHLFVILDFDDPKRFFNTQKASNQMIKRLRPYHESCWKRVTVSLQQSQACSRQCSFPKWTDPFQISSLHSQINWSWKLHFRICWMKMGCLK